MNARNSSANSNPSTRRRTRRHGYRGYGSEAGRGAETFGGAIHWGRGFHGVEIPTIGKATLPSPILFGREKPGE